jgi:hypothetical protein
MMNTINASTGFTPFQLRMGRSPRLIPPLVPSLLNELTLSAPEETERAVALLDRINLDFLESKDNLEQAKILQAYFANKHRGAEIPALSGILLHYHAFVLVDR